MVVSNGPGRPPEAVLAMEIARVRNEVLPSSSGVRRAAMQADLDRAQQAIAAGDKQAMGRLFRMLRDYT